MSDRDDDQNVDRLNELMRVLDRQLTILREQCVRIGRYERLQAARANAQRWKVSRATPAVIASSRFPHP